MATADSAPDTELAPQAAADRWAALVPYAMLAIVLAGGLLWRTPTTPAEMEALASAWHMARDGVWFPLRNGAAAPQIPPLHLWLIVIGWQAFGLAEWWPRVLSALASFGTLALIGRTALALWPHRPACGLFARLLLVGLGGFVVIALLVQAEPLGLLTVLVGCHAVVRLLQHERLGRRVPWYLVFAGALAASLLTLGFAELILLPGLALLAPFALAAAADRRRGYYLPLALALFAGLALPCLWLDRVGGGASLAAIFWRLGNGWLDPATEAARREAWSLLLVPVLLYPWICWKPLWRALARQWREGLGPGLRLCFLFLGLAALAGLAGGWQLQGQVPILAPLALIGARLLAVQEIKAKDFHAVVPALLALLLGLFFFLMNIVPTAHLDALWRELFGLPLPIWLGGIGLSSGFALLAAGYVIAQISPLRTFSRVVQIAALPVLLITCLNLEFPLNLRPFFDLHPVAGKLAVLERAGLKLAVFGAYRGEFDYFGRLAAAPAVLPDREVALAWAAAHPGGAVVSYFDGSPLRLPALPIYRGVARDRWVAIWPSAAVTATQGEALAGSF